jgi:hypothetical protein
MEFDEEKHKKSFHDSVRLFDLEKARNRAVRQATVDYNAGGLARSTIEIVVPNDVIEKQALALGVSICRPPIDWFKDIVFQYFEKGGGICESVEKSHEIGTDLVFAVKFRVRLP